MPRAEHRDETRRQTAFGLAATGANAVSHRTETGQTRWSGRVCTVLQWPSHKPKGIYRPHIIYTRRRGQFPIYIYFINYSHFIDEKECAFLVYYILTLLRFGTVCRAKSMTNHRQPRLRRVAAVVAEVLVCRTRRKRVTSKVTWNGRSDFGCWWPTKCCRWVTYTARYVGAKIWCAEVVQFIFIIDIIFIIEIELNYVF